MILKTYKNIFLFTIVTLIYLSFFNPVEASTEVFFTASSSSFRSGDEFVVDLNITASKNPINVIDGTVIYDKDILEIESVDINQSIFSVWAEEPEFDNKDGKLSFVGGINNGFLGEGGKVFRITWLAKKAGSTTVDFLDNFKVFLNDGKGTSINPWLKPIEISIIPSDKKWQSNIWWTILASLVVIIMVLFILKKYGLFKK